MEPDGKNRKQITKISSGAGNPVWSPDGTRIAFTRWDGTEENIWTMNPDGTGQVNLTAGTWNLCNSSNAYAEWRVKGNVNITGGTFQASGSSGWAGRCRAR